jgi:iron(III) transport system substrate-binding protein
MTNNKFLKDNNLQPPASWNDLLAAPYKNMLQMADARTSGTAVTRIFSVLEVNSRDEAKAFEYMKKLRPNVQLYTKSGGGGTLPVGLGQAGGGIFFIVGRARHQGQGLRRQHQLPEGRHRHGRPRGIAAVKGAKNAALGRKLIDWAPRRDAVEVRGAQDQLRAVASRRAVEASLAGVLKARRSSRSTPTTPAPIASGSWIAGSLKSCPK